MKNKYFLLVVLSAFFCHKSMDLFLLASSAPSPCAGLRRKQILAVELGSSPPAHGPLPPRRLGTFPVRGEGNRIRQLR